MYYSKYIKYKNKYLNLKYQLGGTLDKELKINKFLKSTKIPEISTTLEPIAQTTNSLKNSLIGLKVLDSNSKVLLPLVEYNKKFKDNKIYFYRYTDKKGQSYILCSLFSNRKIFEELQKENVRIQKISIDEFGNISLLIKNISTLKPAKKLDLKGVKKKLMEDLVGIKVLQTNSHLLTPLIKDKEFNKKNKIHYYTYTDADDSYILCSLYDYYEFLDILYEHIEIEEVEIKEKESKVVIMELSTSRIYHRIDKPVSIPNQSITLPLKKNTFDTSAILIDALKTNPFIIIDKQDSSSELLLHEVCMYNLFIGIIHVYVIYHIAMQTNFFLLSLFTQYELEQKCITIPKNIELHECRLYKQGDIIDFKLYREMVDMMFSIYIPIRESGYHKVRFYRGDPAIDNKFLDVLDPILLKECKRCISVKDIAFNTSLFLLPEKIEAKDHKDILEMEKDFLRNKFELINSNQKIQLWRYNYEELIQLLEYSLEDLGKEVEKFKNELLGLEPCHKELLVLKLIEKGYGDEGDTMDEILQKNALCYLKDGEKKKKLVFENSVQIDTNDEFVNDTLYIPEMKELLRRKKSEKNIESELHKYRQTVLMLFKNNDTEIKYKNNRSYFFALSFFDMIDDKTIPEVFSIISWSIKLNKIAFQCLTLKDNIIFPIRIINIQYLDSPLSWALNIIKQEFCGYLHTRFTNNYNGINKFDIECRDKFYFIYRYKDINFIDGSGKTYKPFYYTGNSIKFDISMLPYYKVILCEINWVYYTFILKNGAIPHFYKYTNKFDEIEIVVSIYSLEVIRCIYLSKGYDTTELNKLIEVFYNHNFYKREDITDTIFVENSLFQSQEEEIKFINYVLRRK